jgi:hypothetical protein
MGRMTAVGRQRQSDLLTSRHNGRPFMPAGIARRGTTASEKSSTCSVAMLRQLHFATGRWRHGFLDWRATGSGRALPAGNVGCWPLNLEASFRAVSSEAWPSLVDPEETSAGAISLPHSRRPNPHTGAQMRPRDMA